MKPIGDHGFAALAILVVVQTMTWACSSRSGAVPAPPSPAPSQQATPATPAESTPDAGPDECALLAEPGEPVAIVGLTNRVDPSNAPRPTNTSERLLFSQLYETLVRVDCMGRVLPGLATSWRSERSLPPGSRVWTLTLREDARFSDGAPVTAADVRAGWIRDGIDRQFPAYVSPLVQMVHVVDDRTLVIQLASGRGDAPVALAHPELAVARSVADLPWPLGTRSSQIEGTGAVRGRLSELTVGRDSLPPLTFLVGPGDPRDLLDAGVDLLLTRNPATLDYASTLPHLQRVPLAWQHTYVYLTGGRLSSSPLLSENARRALAADAVRGEARGAEGPFSWEGSECFGTRSGFSPFTPAARVVYDSNDEAARDLAERFVALASASGPAATAFLDVLLPDRPRWTIQRAVGLTGVDLANARLRGTDAGYIVSLESRPLEPCHAVRALQDQFPWLNPPMIVPLVDARLNAVVRRGRSGVTTDFDGSVHVDDPNPRSR